MDGANINGLLSGLLQNPQMLNGIFSLVSNMKNTMPPQQDEEKTEDTSEEKLEEQAAPAGLFGDLFSGSRNNMQSGCTGTTERRKNLLIALKPFMCRERCEKIDFILNVLTLLDMAQELGITNLKL